MYKAYEARGIGTGILGVQKKFRLVIYLSQLNTYLADVTFQMDTLEKVQEALRPGMWVTSLDLSDAYLRKQEAVSRTWSYGERRQVRTNSNTIEKT